MDHPLSLCWNDYLNEVTEAFGSLRDEEDLVDVTLSCEGKSIKAHKMLLSACSPYFRDVFKDNPCQHPVIVFKNVKFLDLRAIVDFIYCGKVEVLQEQLESFLTTAELLMVKGLTDKENESQVVETSGITKTDSDGSLERRYIKSTESRNETSLSTVTSRPSSPPAKRRRSNTENSQNKSSVSSELKEEVRFIDVSALCEEATVVKEEVEFSDVEDDDVMEEDFSVTEPEVNKLVVPKKSKRGPKSSKSKSAADLPKTSQNIGKNRVRGKNGGGDVQGFKRCGVEKLDGKKEKVCIECSGPKNEEGKRKRSRTVCVKCNRGLHLYCATLHSCKF